MDPEQRDPEQRDGAGEDFGGESDRSDLRRPWSALGVHDVDHRVADRIRRRALGVLAQERIRREQPVILATLGRWWDVWAEPTVGLAVTASYLAWMVHALAALR